MKLIKYSVFMALLLILAGCNDFLDVNTNPTKVSEGDVNVDVLLPTVITGSGSATFSEGYYASRVTHYMDNIQSGYYEKFTMSGAWSTIYLRNLNNIEVIIDKAKDEGSPYYVGIAKILKAYNLGLLTDAWENVPYSEALLGSNNVTPSYDKQEVLYKEIQKLLDEAISDLSVEENFRNPAADDFIYSGDMEKWLKLAHSLKARYMVHLSNKPDMDWNAVLSEVEKGFESNDDDFELIYNPDNANPWYSSVSKRILEAIYTLTYGAYFIDDLNGTNLGIIDPRLFVLVEKVPGDTTDGYHGLASYDPDAEPYNVLPTVNTYYMGASSPVVMMSYSELKFIEAEAALKVGDNARAQEAYEKGINANMNKLGVKDEDIVSYMTAPNISTVSLSNIMTQKYIALVLNPEAWNDMRRYDFDGSIFLNFVVPEYNGRTKPAQRAIYPDSEASRNKANYEANYKDFTEKMWKDKN